MIPLIRLVQAASKRLIRLIMITTTNIHSYYRLAARRFKLQAAYEGDLLLGKQGGVASAAMALTMTPAPRKTSCHRGRRCGAAQVSFAPAARQLTVYLIVLPKKSFI